MVKMLEKFAEKIVKIQVKYPKLVILAILLISFILAPGILKIKIEPSLEKVLPQDIHVIETMNDMRIQFGADMVYVVIEPEYALDMREPEIIKYLDVLQNKLTTSENILEVSSLATIIKEDKGFIPDSIQEIKNILDSDPRTYKFANDDYSLTFLQLRTDTGANAKLIGKLKSDINDNIASLDGLNPGVKAHVTGFNIIDKATFDIMISDFAFETPLAFALIGIIVFLVFRSLLKGLIPMVVVMVSMMWTSGLIGYFGIILSSTNIVAAAMVMGLGIDFGIHILHRFYELKAKMSREKALMSSLKENIRATTAAALTTSAGFLALLFGSLPAMKNFGIILTMGIMFAMIAAIVVLPAVIFLYDRSRDRKIEIKLAKRARRY